MFMLLGFPVYVPASAWIGIALIAFLNEPAFVGNGGTLATLAFAFGLYATVLVHELAHAIMARRTGHHVLAIRLGILGGATSYDAARHPNPKHEMRVALSGPLTNIAIGLALQVALPTDKLSPPIVVLGLLGFMNLVLGVLNLLPAAPLDGGHVCEALVWRLTGSRRAGMRATSILGYLLGVLAFMSGMNQLDTVNGQWLIIVSFILVMNAGVLWGASRNPRIP
jgi:Zn-dependent protease